MAGKIFLNYRREDAAGFALALFGRLEQSFPAESLFMDVEGGIGAGQDFVRVIEEQVSACDVMLVLIGPNWLTVRDDVGRRRLDNPRDFVRIEIESALRFGKRVIPVLVQKTEMPRADALPETLEELARRNAVGLTQERFKVDAQGLIKALEDALAEVEQRRRQAATKTPAAEQERVIEQAAKAEETVRTEKERARLDAIAGLSPEQISKAEELANWDLIKASEKVEDFRDHLARFPQGVSERWARTRLEGLVWTGLPQPLDMSALKGFLAEFPNGPHASETNAKLSELEAQAAAEREATEREKREMDAWASASARGTVAALEDFRSDWPSSRYAAAARTRVETGLIRTFAGHTAQVQSVAFSPDGHGALSGSKDKTVKLWDVATGKEMRSFTEHADPVMSVAFSPDGRNALSGSLDKTLKLWDVATAKEIRTFAGHTNFVTWVAFSPDGLTALSGSFDKTLKLWDVATAKEIRTFAGHSNGVTSVAFSPDGRTALSGSYDKSLKLWDIATGREILSFTGHTDVVDSVAFSPDSRSVLSGSWDRTLKLWDVATGKEIRTFTEHTNWVHSVAFSPDGRSALSCSEDDTLKLWDVPTGKEIRTFTKYTDWVSSVAFSPDGLTALSGSYDHTLKLWDLIAGP
jgi:hypothetical protein